MSSGRMRRGTASACAKAQALFPGELARFSMTRGHVLRSVQRPVRVTSCSPNEDDESRRTWDGHDTVGICIAVGQIPRLTSTGRNQSRGASERAQRGSPRITAFANSSEFRKVERDAYKRKEVMASFPQRGDESSGSCPYVVAVAEVGKQRLGFK